MLTQIWSALTDIMFCHFRSFSALLPHYWPRKLKFRKNVKKILEILSFYTRVPLLKIIYNLDMIYGSWDMTFKRQSYFVILGHFFPFSPLTAWKMKISKIKKKPLRYHHFTQGYQKSWSDVMLFLRYCGCWM